LLTRATDLAPTRLSRGSRLDEKERYIKQIISYLAERSVSPGEINPYLQKYDTSTISQKLKAISIAARPQVELAELLLILGGTENLEAFSSPRFKEICQSAEIAIKYEGYIVREKLIAQKITRLENVRIPDDISYLELASISTEARQKLTRIKPANIGHASRISGVSPSDINILLMYLGR
jgi:tRNA uridine 5-carboxymethylaminomethyl modification enzyme